MISNRIARWVLQLQEYDIEISHIRSTQKYLADVISRNNGGLTSEKIKQLTRHRDIMVASIKLNIYPRVKKGLKELAAFQDNKQPGSRSTRLAVCNPRWCDSL